MGLRFNYGRKNIQYHKPYGMSTLKIHSQQTCVLEYIDKPQAQVTCYFIFTGWGGCKPGLSIKFISKLIYLKYD